MLEMPILDGVNYVTAVERSSAVPRQLFLPNVID